MNPKTLRILNKVRKAHKFVAESSLTPREKEAERSQFDQIVLAARNIPSRKTIAEGEYELRELCKKYLDEFSKGDKI